MTVDRIVENPQTSSDIVAKLVGRSDYYKGIEEELTSKLNLVKEGLSREKIIQEKLAICLLVEAIQVRNEKAHRFAFKLLECVENGGSMDLFFENNPDLKDLDLSPIFGKNKAFRKFLKPVKNIHVSDLPMDLKLIEGARKLDLGDANQEKIKTVKERLRPYPGVQIDTIEEAKALVPSVKLLFDGELDIWMKKNDKKVVSLETLLGMFIRKKTLGNQKKDMTAVRHAIMYHDGSLLARFLTTNVGKSRDKYDLFEQNGTIFLSAEYCEKFFVFLTNNIFNSRRLLIDFNEDWNGGIPVKIDDKAIDIDHPSSELSIDVPPQDVQGMSTEAVLREPKFLPWMPEEIEDFFNTNNGKKIYENIQNNSIIYAEYLIIVKDTYPTARIVLENDLCWQKDYQNDDVRTHIDNLLNLIRFNFGNGRKLTDMEKNDFIVNKIKPVWKRLTGKDNIGMVFSGLIGENFLSKNEYMWAVYLLDALFLDENLNKEQLGLSKADNIKKIEMKREKLLH